MGKNMAVLSSSDNDTHTLLIHHFRATTSGNESVRVEEANFRGKQRDRSVTSGLSQI